MRAVWKYALGHGRNELEMPVGARLVHVDNQAGRDDAVGRGRPRLAHGARTFQFVGTGHTIDFEGEHVGSALFMGGVLVFHLYEVVS